jgi:hypothetical protein
METIKINKTFASYEECEKWESENFKDNRYEGRIILCINHTETAGNDEITLDSVMVF